jgi:hypothetical protein
MSYIKIKKNILSTQWIIQDLCDDENYDNVDVHFGFFNENEQIVEFNTLTYGCDLYLNEQIIQSKKYPSKNINMFKTESEYMEIIRFNVEPGTDYKIKIWCNNSAVYQETFVTFTTPPVANYSRNPVIE